MVRGDKCAGKVVHEVGAIVDAKLTRYCGPLHLAECLVQRGLDPLRSEGNLANPRARGVKDGIPNGLCHDGYGSLARPGRSFVSPVDQLDLDLWNIETQRQAPVAFPVD